ncbi:MAG: ABC transporter substrate-binding protein [Candidatus Bathyarchaeia archaeon]
MRGKFFSAIAIVLIIAIPMLMIPQSVKAQRPEWLPVPREESLIIYGASHQYPYSVFDNFNPLVPAIYSETYHVGLVQGVWEAPWYINYATGEVVYWLCTGWEYRDNYTKFIMYLRRGVTYSDGHPFTAHDLVTDIKVRLSDPKISGYPFLAEYVKNYYAADDYTLVVELTKPYPRFHYMYQGWGGTVHTALPKHIWDNVANPLDFKYFPPIGTGPYKLYGVYPEQKVYVWVRRDDYWAKDAFGMFPEPKYLVFRSAPPYDVMLEEFVRGLFDVYQNPPIEILRSAVVRYENTTVIEYLDPCPNTVLLNTAKYPLNYSQVRWAIALAIDRDKIAKFWAYSLTVPDPAIFPWGDYAGLRKYVYPDIFNKYKLEYNIAKANQLLDQLGFIDVDGDGIRETPNGTKLSFDLITLGPPGEFLEVMAAEISNSLKQIGIEAKEKILAWGVYFDNIQTGLFDMAACWVCTGMTFNQDPFGLLSVFWSIYMAPIGERNRGGGWETTSSRFTDPELDGIIEKAANMYPDDPETQALYKRGIEIIMREMPVIPVSQKIFTVMASSTYWKNWPTPENFYAWPAMHWGEFLFVILGIKSTRVPPTPPPPVYVTVYAKAGISAFTGVDGKPYGPYKAGDTMVIPKEDADRLVAQGLASYSPPVPAELPEIAKAVSDLLGKVSALETTLSGLSSNVNTLSSSIDKLSSRTDALSGQVAGITTVVVGMGVITAVLVIIAIVMLLRKK